MMQSLTSILRYNGSRILAVARKDWLIRSRFKYRLLVESVLAPTRIMVLFLLLYVFTLGFPLENLIQVESRYILMYALIGSLIYVSFNSARYIERHYQMLKHWQVLDGLKISCYRAYELFLGTSLAILPTILPMLALWYILLSLIAEITLLNILISFFVIVITYYLVAGVSFLVAGLMIYDENLVALADVVYPLWIFASCLYYPIEVFPVKIQWVIMLNPLFHSKLLLDAIFLNEQIPLLSCLFLIIATVLVVVIGIIGFSILFKKCDAPRL